MLVMVIDILKAYLGLAALKNDISSVLCCPGSISLNHMEADMMIDSKVSIQEYIEFYNGYRPRSTIGYLTPNEAEEAYFANSTVS